MEYVERKDEAIDDLSETLLKIDCELERVANHLDAVPQLREELEARIEAIKMLQEDVPNTDGAPKTVLTPEDGRANRIRGHEQQDEMAQALRGFGFEVTVGHGIGKPDFKIRMSGGVKITAVGSNKAYTLHDELKRMQRRVTYKDCLPEAVLAKKLGVPMVLFVTNTSNGRRDMLIVGPDELKEWKGVSTSVRLAKNDARTGAELEEEFAKGIVALGGKA